MNKLFKQITPFIFIGAALVALTFSIFILAYLLLFGAFVGIILFALNWLRARFLTPGKISSLEQYKNRSGRIIDIHEWTKRN